MRFICYLSTYARETYLEELSLDLDHQAICHLNHQSQTLNTINNKYTSSHIQATYCKTDVAFCQVVKSSSVLHLRTNSEISDTSDILSSCYFLFVHVPTLIFLSPFVLFLFTPAYSFCPTLSYYHTIDNHVVLFSSCSCIMC